MKFKNFKIWRGKLPHWRADDVQYYVTFRHRRPLSAEERLLLFRSLLRPDGRKWDLVILSVLPEITEMIFTVREASHGEPYELSKIVEKAKSQTGSKIVKKTGEPFPPFFNESFDRIIRDEAEFEEKWQEIFDGPVAAELVEDQDEWQTLWVKEAI